MCIMCAKEEEIVVNAVQANDDLSRVVFTFVASYRQMIKESYTLSVGVPVKEERDPADPDIDVITLKKDQRRVDEMEQLIQRVRESMAEVIGHKGILPSLAIVLISLETLVTHLYESEISRVGGVRLTDKEKREDELARVQGGPTRSHEFSELLNSLSNHKDFLKDMGIRIDESTSGASSGQEGAGSGAAEGTGDVRGGSAGSSGGAEGNALRGENRQGDVETVQAGGDSLSVNTQDERLQVPPTDKEHNGEQSPDEG